MIYELPDRIGFSLRFFSLTHGTKGATKMKRLLTAGIFGTILGIVGTGTANASIVSSGFLDEKLTEYALSTSLDLKANQSDLTALSNKIGTLPSAILPSMWTDVPYYTETGVNMPDAGFTLPTTIGEQLELILNGGVESPIDRMFRVITLAGNGGVPVGTVDPGTNDPGADFLGLYPLTNGWTDSVSGTTYLGIKDLNTKIGTLPSGNFPIFPYSKQMFDIINFEYPQNLSQLIYALFGNTETNTHGALSYLMNDIIGNVPFGGNNISEIIGEPIQTGRYTIPIYELIYWGTNNSTYLLPNMNGTFSDAPLLGLYELSNRIEKIGTVPDGKNLAGMIGTLPAGYDSVGAALTAIKGIAEDAKAAALAAIPDPKQEGSSGKFVLTVDIVGDNATYRWEKIDREGETTTTE